MEGGEHGIDRIERPIDPSGLDIFRAFSEARVNIYGGSLGRSQHLVSVDQLLGRNDDHALVSRDFDKISLVQAELVADLLGDDDLPALANLADKHRLPPCGCIGLDDHTVRLSDGNILSSPGITVAS